MIRISLSAPAPERRRLSRVERRYLAEITQQGVAEIRARGIDTIPFSHIRNAFKNWYRRVPKWAMASKPVPTSYWPQRFISWKQAHSFGLPPGVDQIEIPMGRELVKVCDFYRFVIGKILQNASHLGLLLLTGVSFAVILNTMSLLDDSPQSPDRFNG